MFSKIETLFCNLFGGCKLFNTIGRVFKERRREFLWVSHLYDCLFGALLPHFLKSWNSLLKWQQISWVVFISILLILLGVVCCYYYIFQEKWVAVAEPNEHLFRVSSIIIGYLLFITG